MPRIDKLLLDQGLCRSRTQAKQLIDAKKVYYRQASVWTCIDRPSKNLPASAELKIEDSSLNQYVSRGGLKLEAAIKTNKIDLTGSIALDVGQSTGGFTDCLLQRGAEKVVGIEVGHSQLVEALRSDPRIIVFEGTNARNMPEAEILKHAPEGFDIAVMDVSFISQTLIIPGISSLLKPTGHFISLVKPQFEVGPKGIGKGGIVTDTSLYNQVKERITECCNNNKLSINSWIDSPIKGGDGNKEFLIHATRKS